MSPILFNLMLSDLPTSQTVKVISYADDITLTTTAKDIHKAKKEMQSYLNYLPSWLEKWKLQVNPQKTTFQIFTTKRNIPYITLRLLSHNLNSTTQQRLLGVILDAPKLTFAAHIKHLEVDCKRRLHVIRALSSTEWGCHRTILRRVYMLHISEARWNMAQ